MGMWKIEGDDYEDGKITAIYVSHEFYGFDYAKFVPARPRGEWEFIGENLFMCTKCGYIADANYLEKWKAHTFDSNFPDFCPKCGADMRKEEEAE